MNNLTIKRWILRPLLVLVGVYVLFWVGLAIYFSLAERHKGLLEANLTSLFGRTVTIDRVVTSWQGISPAIQINGFQVQGDLPHQPALAFEALSAEVAPLSLLQFWPRFTDLAASAPQLEIVSLPSNRLQIAGIEIGGKSGPGIDTRRLVSWLLNHENASWLNGEVVWRKRNGSQQRYTDVSFVYERNAQNRTWSAAALTEKGAMAIRAVVNGNMLDDSDWDASVEVLGDGGQQLVSKDDLSLVVEQGKGVLSLAALSVERVREFIQLAGFGEAAKWIIDSELSGSLKNVHFNFSGPFLQFDEWSFDATALSVGFLATDISPSMNNLQGRIVASSEGGEFQFSSDKAIFSWPRWFDQDFAIQRAEGRFEWQIDEQGKIDIKLGDSTFSDGVLTITSIDARSQINYADRQVNSLSSAFGLPSLDTESIEKAIVSNESLDQDRSTEMHLTATAKFDITDLGDTARYLPNTAKLKKLKTWWSNAFLAGQVSDAELRYDGLISSQALKQGTATINGRANYENVSIDYGYQTDWPVLKRARGVGLLENDQLTILPTEAWLAEDQVTNATVTISELFNLTRTLRLKGAMQTSLTTVAELLFNGPLTPLEQKKRQEKIPFPVQAKGGVVDAEVEVSIPLRNIRDTRVFGKATVVNGHITLPSGVPLERVATKMKFTERSASAEQITAHFLGGDLRARLSTVKKEQPPVLKFEGGGRGNVEGLEPWIGEHLLTWFGGDTEWQGEVNIDGSEVSINLNTDLKGVTVTAPPPLAKTPGSAMPLQFSMLTGGPAIEPELGLHYGRKMRVQMRGDKNKRNTFFDRAHILVAEDTRVEPKILPPGINFDMAYPELDLDAWLEAVIDLATLDVKPLAKRESENTLFLDAMRRVNIDTPAAKLLGREFGATRISAVSVDGWDWVGTLIGDHVNGAISAKPRDDVPTYDFNFARFHLVEAPAFEGGEPPQAEPIEPSLRPGDYPIVSFYVNDFIVAEKQLGALKVVGMPKNNKWVIETFSLDKADIRTLGSGEWVNNEEDGSLTTITYHTEIDEAGGVLDDMQFNDLIRKGSGVFKGKLHWIGAPHEFDFARLNGNFDLQINDGELLQVESGAGRLIGLLNFNSILRRITLDFRDVFSQGFKFDRMQYTGVVAEGKAIMQEAFMLSPAAFVQMEGSIDLNREEIDMEIHASPELGGNLTLLSAIANPAAGAVVYIAQRIFKDQMRSTNFQSYRARGTWDEFELEELKGNEVQE